MAFVTTALSGDCKVDISHAPVQAFTFNSFQQEIGPNGNGGIAASGMRSE